MKLCGIRKKHKRLSLAEILDDPEIDICVVAGTRFGKRDIEMVAF